MAVPVRARRFTVDEFEQMARAGILGEDDHVELIEGEIIEMAPIGRKHPSRVRRIIRRFARVIGTAAILDVQNPLNLGERSEPQPDVVVLRSRADFYDAFHPTALDVLLLIEVADTSLDYDLAIKVPLYARAGIVEVWLVDLEHDVVVLYRDPSPEGYRIRRSVHRGDQIFPLAFPDAAIPVEDLLG